MSDTELDFLQRRCYFNKPEYNDEELVELEL